ncbi:MAG: hypothetical protein IIC64_19275, partial [SAR324 cluster bacterium]|nr:hypothetical protein [SAR324 cluster bacterium]
MKKNIGSFGLRAVPVTVFLSSILLFAFLLAVLTPTNAQGLPKGVKVVLVSEHNPNIPGIAKVTVQRMTMEPGAVIKLTVKGIPFCDATKGIITVTNQATGATTTFGVGSRWAPTEGITVTLKNNGSEIHEHYITRIVR